MTAPVPDVARPAASPSSLNTRVVGGLLLVFGTGWMLKQTGVVDMPWSAVVSLVLIALGLALVITARSRAHAVPLIILGAVLTAGLAIGSSNIALSGGVGDRPLRPASLSSDNAPYHLGVGQLTLDLRTTAIGSPVTTVKADVGVGHLVVRVPRDIGLRVEADTRFGNAVVFGTHLDIHGKASDSYTSPGYETATQKLHLILHVGAGQIDVTR